MKRKVLLLLSKLMNIVTVLSTLAFMGLNFENLTVDFMYGFFGRSDPTKSLHARYRYWLEDIYGKEEGFEAYWKIVDFTTRIIEHHINEKIFIVIILMMLGSIWINKKIDKKMNKILRRYFIFCILLMLWTTFVAGPQYLESFD